MSVDSILPTREMCRQLNKDGHLYVPNVYDPQLGEYIGSELDLFFGCVKNRQTMAGELKRSTEQFVPDLERHPNLYAVLQAMGEFTSTALSSPEHDRRIWPSPIGHHALIQSIDMDPNTIRHLRASQAIGATPQRVFGAWHADRLDIVDLVAITTYEGESAIQIEDSDTYTLRPGGVIFFDNTRRPQLWHRGYADQPRRALGLATISNKVLS